MAAIDRYTKKEIIEELLSLRKRMTLRYSESFKLSQNTLYYINKAIKESTVGRYVLRTMDDDDEVITLCKLYFPELYSCTRGFYWSKTRRYTSCYPFRVIRPTMLNPKCRIKPIILTKGVADYLIPKSARLEGFENNWK